MPHGKLQLDMMLSLKQGVWQPAPVEKNWKWLPKTGFARSTCTVVEFEIGDFKKFRGVRDWQNCGL